MMIYPTRVLVVMLTLIGLIALCVFAIREFPVVAYVLATIAAASLVGGAALLLVSWATGEDLIGDAPDCCAGQFGCSGCDR